jgi:hypothetical protein
MNFASEQGVLNVQWNAAVLACAAEEARQHPSVLYRPQLFADGTMWCTLLGENLQIGVSGFGETPEKAMAAFDEAWHRQKTPAAMLKEKP